MKTKKNVLLAALSLAGLLTAAAPSRAASFTEAQFTRLENEVKVLKENSAPHTAAVGENVNAVSSVATGANSRAELRFPDKSLTRLGANSRFTIRGEERTLDLEKGVMMLSVPKKMGGAKVRTAAVTAAVTGTTCIYEYMPNGYIKLIVIEGVVTAYSNKDRSHFQEIHAGQMLIMDPNSLIIPPPVDIDLKRILKTSPLLKDYQNMPNYAYMNQALLDQQKDLKNGTLLNTNLVIPGLGTIVSLTGNDAHTLDGLTVQNVPRSATNPGGGGLAGSNNPPPDAGPKPPKAPVIPPAFHGFLPLISGTTVLNSTSTVVPDPTVTAFNTDTGGVLTSQGLIYHGQAVDGPFAYFVFGSGKTDHALQSLLNTSNGWGSFKFESLFINGTPDFSIPESESLRITDVILASRGAITLSGSNPFGEAAGGPDGSEGGPGLYLSSTMLTGLLLYSQQGGINLASDFRIVGSSQDLALKALGLGSDVNIQGNITLGNTGILIVGAGRDVLIPGDVSAGDVNIKAGRNIVITGNGVPPPGPTSLPPTGVKANNGSLSLSAIHNIQITDSAQLVQLASAPDGGLLRMQSQKGSITLSGNVQVKGNSVEIQAFSGNVTILTSSVSAANILTVRSQGNGSALTIGGSTLNASRFIQLYAEGNNSSVVFTDDTTLAKISGNPHSPMVQIAAVTVAIANGKVVTITQAGPVKIYTDNALFNIAGYGQFVRMTDSGPKPVKESNILPYASRPKFHGGPRFGPRPKPGGLAPPFTPPRPTVGG